MCSGIVITLAVVHQTWYALNTPEDSFALMREDELCAWGCRVTFAPWIPRRFVAGTLEHLVGMADGALLVLCALVVFTGWSMLARRTEWVTYCVERGGVLCIGGVTCALSIGVSIVVCGGGITRELGARGVGVVIRWISTTLRMLGAALRGRGT